VCIWLEEKVAGGHDLLDLLHVLAWALLTTSPSEVMDNDLLCPIRRFLVPHFLQENRTFVPVQYMTGDFSPLLMFFRCFGCYHLLQNTASHEKRYFRYVTWLILSFSC